MTSSIETTKAESLIIADTSGLYSLINPFDRNHNFIVQAARELTTEATALLVPWDIFVETINTTGKKNGHDLALSVARYLQETPLFAIAITADRSVFDDALARYAEQPQSVSFTDCIVMAVADSYQTKEIFGFDLAFARNGYRILQQNASKTAA